MESWCMCGGCEEVLRGINRKIGKGDEGKNSHKKLVWMNNIAGNNLKGIT